MGYFEVPTSPVFEYQIEKWNKTTRDNGEELSVPLGSIFGNTLYNKSHIERIKDPKYATLVAAGWSGSAPYTQTVTVEGITAADTPIIALSIPKGLSGDTVKAQKKAYGMVDRAESGDGQITFYCYNKKPAVDFQAVIKGV